MQTGVETVVIEPCLLLREGLVRILADADFDLAAHARHLDELTFPATDRQILIVLAVPESSADVDDLICQIKIARLQFPSGRIVLLSAGNDAQICFQALRAGANACITKSHSAEVLVKALELVALGAAAVPVGLLQDLLDGSVGLSVPAEATGPKSLPDLTREIRVDAPHLRAGLSIREMSILHCLQCGESNKMIARRFDLAEATVKVHVKAILRKTGARNRTQAAIWALGQAPDAAGAIRMDSISACDDHTQFA